MSGPIPGEDSDSRISFRCPDLLLDQFDEFVDESSHGNRSDAIRSAMRELLDDEPDNGMPRHPPSEPQLAHGYERLCMAANTNGIIPGDTARRVSSGGPNQLAKTETADLVLKPLQRRGYIGRQGNVYGDEAWCIYGLEEARTAASEVATDGGEPNGE